MIENVGPHEQTKQRRHTKADLIEVFPYGLSLGPQISRPVLLFQDERGDLRLPIWLRPLEAAASLAYLDEQTVVSAPFGTLTQILEELRVRIDRCVLDEIQGHRQTGVLHFTGPKSWRIRTMRRPADEVVNVGLTQGARFYTTPEFVRKSREMNEEILDVEAHLKAFPAQGRKTHRYLM